MELWEIAFYFMLKGKYLPVIISRKCETVEPWTDSVFISQF